MSELEKYVLATLFVVWILAMFVLGSAIVPQIADNFLRVLP